MPEDLTGTGLAVPEILLPAEGVDLSRWSVIACDQFTSDRSYWEEVDRFVGDAPSTLRITLPEVYLEEARLADRVKAINRTMDQYLDSGVLVAAGYGWVLVDRSTRFVESRKGLVVALDLEAYSFRDAGALVRPTEGTVLDRLPPRMDIRRGAKLDLPHILLLMDDPGRTVIEPLFGKRGGMKQLYDFELNQGGGHLAGWLVDVRAARSTAEKFKELANEGLLFVVGDGNHSLAAARQLWEEKKQQGAPGDDPARYILLEVENIHDPGLEFHPINRVLFGVKSDDFLREMESRFGGRFAEGPVEPRNPAGDEHFVGVAFPGREGMFTFNSKDDRMTVEHVQDFLDDYLSGNPSVSVDYIHDRQPARQLASEDGNMGIFLPPIDKSALFEHISRKGTYPRKTFSIGEAPEKRYYLEARKLKN